MNYFISDLHLGHSNMLKYEDDRWKFLEISRQFAISNYIINNKLEKEFANDNLDFKTISSKVNDIYVKKFTDKIIEAWNNKVTDKDTVYILGDLFFLGRNMSFENALSILLNLNGHKHLIIGNHDEEFVKKYDSLIDKKESLESISYYKTIKDNDNFIVMCHYPIEVWDKKDYGAIHLHGHTHNSKQEMQIKNRYNVGCMLHEFVPVSIQELLGGKYYE